MKLRLPRHWFGNTLAFLALVVYFIVTALWILGVI